MPSECRRTIGRFVLDGFVDVVAEKNDELGIFVGQMPVRGKIAVLVVGAGDKAEAQAINGAPRRRQGNGAAHRARRIAALEAIPIGAAGLETRHIEVDRIGKGPLGGGLATAHDVAQRIVGRNLVGDRHIAPAHTARRFRIGRQRLRRKPRPQHEAVGARRAGSDAETERIARTPTPPPRMAA